MTLPVAPQVWTPEWEARLLQALRQELQGKRGAGDIELQRETLGGTTRDERLILRSSDGTRYALTIDDGGALWVTQLDGTRGVVWRDLIGNITLKGTPGANSPTWKEITGMTGMYGYAFSASTMNEVWINYHIDHDYYRTSDIFLHTHWLNAAATPNTGVVRWGFQYTVAKGHQQQAFPATTTIYVNQTCNATRYMHHIAEVSSGDAVDGTNIEPDTLILCRIFRDAANAADTCTDEVFLLLSDCHYQADRSGTLGKAPDFYSA